MLPVAVATVNHVLFVLSVDLTTFSALLLVPMNYPIPVQTSSRSLISSCRRTLELTFSNDSIHCSTIANRRALHAPLLSWAHSRMA